MKNSIVLSPLEPLLKVLNLPSPLQELELSHHSDYQVFIKRDDLIHPYISGNKWRKLKYNLLHFMEGSYDGIISFGGPFSNHLVALATSCNILDLPCLGLVRSLVLDSNNPTLQIMPTNGNEATGNIS